MKAAMRGQCSKLVMTAVCCWNARECRICSPSAIIQLSRHRMQCSIYQVQEIAVFTSIVLILLTMLGLILIVYFANITHRFFCEVL
jgi:hypothetical protein